MHQNTKGLAWLLLATVGGGDASQTTSSIKTRQAQSWAGASRNRQRESQEGQPSARDRRQPQVPRRASRPHETVASRQETEGFQGRPAVSTSCKWAPQWGTRCDKALNVCAGRQPRKAEGIQGIQGGRKTLNAGGPLLPGPT